MPLAPIALGLSAVLTSAAAGRLQLDTANPHYFSYKGKPLVLVTSGEHYGAVINGAFDYNRYLAELQSKGLNHTRIWTGPYREVAGSFNISANTLAPAPANFKIGRAHV